MTKDINEANLITHASKFHADDVFATALMSHIIDDPVVCRVNSFIDGVNEKAIVYDIGGGKFDHHMRDFDLRHNDGAKYAAFGLLFKNYGLEFLKKYDAKNATLLFNMIEHDLVSGIDAVDNGEFPSLDVSYNYKSLDAVIADFNVCWDEDVDNDLNFMKAVEFANIVLENCLKRNIAKVKAKEKVDMAIENCNGPVMYLECNLPFKDFVVTSTNPKAKDILFVITPSNRGGYNINTIPKSRMTYETRCDFPQTWGGLVDDDLQKVSGVQSAKFCHSSLFLAVCLELNDAYKMANLAIEWAKNQD